MVVQTKFTELCEAEKEIRELVFKDHRRANKERQHTKSKSELQNVDFF